MLSPVGNIYIIHGGKPGDISTGKKINIYVYTEHNKDKVMKAHIKPKSNSCNCYLMVVICRGKWLLNAFRFSFINQM